MNTFAGPFLLWLGRVSWQASVIALLVMAAQKVFPSRWTAQWRYALWLLVVLRLALPVAIPSKISLFNYGRGWGASLSPSIISAPWPSSGNDAIENGPPPQAAPARPVIKHAWWRRRSWEFLFSLWLGGAVIFAARTFGQNWLFLRRLGTPRPVVDQDALALLANCRKELGVRTKVRLAETSAVKSPALCGLWRPMLLLPAGLTGQFSAAELRHVFLHEMAHVRRGDAFVLWLAASLQALHWFNPVIWLAVRRMAADREMACDELALFHAGEEEKTPYGQTILKLLELFACATPPALVGILEDGAQMRRRILMISGFKKRPLWPLPAFLLLLGLGIVTLTDAQPPVETSDNLAGALPRGTDERVISESLRKWSHDEVVAAADYQFCSNVLAKLLFVPRDQLGSELATAYPGHLDPELAELRLRLLHAKDKWIAAQNDGATDSPAYKTASESYTNAQRDYDAKINSIIDGLKDRVKEDASNLVTIKSREAALKREWERAKTAGAASVNTDPFLKAEEKRQSESPREWTHDEVMAAADYAIFSNTFAKLLSIPKDERGSELLTAYPGNSDPELAELHTRFDQAKDKWLAAQNELDTNLPAFKTASEVYTKAQQDYDAKIQSMINGIKVRVETDAANLQIIRDQEAAIKSRRAALAKAAAAAAAQSTGGGSAPPADAEAPPLITR
ncbi:MAG: M56 family metallopeptidase [Limisphaerales bacterium]